MQEAVFATTLAAAGNINVYDIRKKCVGSLCYDFSLMEEYLGQPEVQHALGVEGRSWVECNAIVYGDFLADWMLEVSVPHPLSARPVNCIMSRWRCKGELMCPCRAVCTIYAGERASLRACVGLRGCLLTVVCAAVCDYAARDAGGRSAHHDLRRRPGLPPVPLCCRQNKHTVV